LFPWRNKVVNHTTAIFRQVNKQRLAAHHDALEFPNGQIVLLTLLAEGQQATVLQLPAGPKYADDLERQKRVAYVGRHALNKLPLAIRQSYYSCSQFKMKEAPARDAGPVSMLYCCQRYSTLCALAILLVTIREHKINPAAA
jgi:hypothetical protein